MGNRKDAAVLALKEGSRHILVGGQSVGADGHHADGTAVSTVECLEWKVQRAWRLPSLPQGRIGCGLAAVGDYIYCIGGLASSTSSAQGEAFELPVVLPSVAVLTLKPPQITAWISEVHHSSKKNGDVSGDEEVKESNSSKSSNNNNSDEEDVATREIQLMVPRWAPAVATIQNYIFVLGGRNASWEELSTAEVGVVTPETGQVTFSKIPYALREKRFGAAAVPLSESTFVVCGGFDGIKWLKSCCVYEIENKDDPKDGHWKDLPAMPKAVTFAQAVYCAKLPEKNGSAVFVAGGSPTGGRGCLQMYHIESSEWTVISETAPFSGAALIATDNRLIAYGVGGDQVFTLELKEATSPPSPAPAAPAPALAAAAASRNSQSSIPSVAAVSTKAPASTPPDVLVVSDAIAVPISSVSSLGAGVNGSSGARSGPPPFRTVQDFDCIVEGEMARYTGPLNEQGQRHGRGFLIWADSAGRYYPKEMSRNTYYEGEFVNDSRVGQGVMFFDKEDRIYRGNFSRGVLNGPDGHLFDGQRGLEYSGSFRKGTPSGEGMCTYNNRKQTWSGLWKGGKPLVGEWKDAQGNILQEGSGPWKADLSID